MVAFQSVLLEMLSDYHGGAETQDLRDKLKSSWPLGTGMASALDSLRKELKKEMDTQLELVKRCYVNCGHYLSWRERVHRGSLCVKYFFVVWLGAKVSYIAAGTSSQ